MRLRLLLLMLLTILSINYGTRAAHCGSEWLELGGAKPNVSREVAVGLFTDANEKYAQAAKLAAAKSNLEAAQLLQEAALQYETILAGGFRHGQIYYNLGNVYYRQGKLGKSILNYRRAQRLMPRNGDVDANLSLVKTTTEDKELSSEIPPVVQKTFFWFFMLNQNELTVVAISLYVTLMILITLFIFFKFPWCRGVIIGFSAGLLIVLASLGIKIYREEGITCGVVTTKCQVRYGPGGEYEPKFEIHDGAECVIEGEKNDWYRVYVNVGVKEMAGTKTGGDEKANSKEVRSGWLRKGEVEKI
ncbi:MAG TPA: tetratricopeptide repeat protein [Candidatus Brocadiaceae bacterium]|nr:tetratricopeptide repeat protein [Candidatus Brocadiaceae bacterium]